MQLIISCVFVALKYIADQNQTGVWGPLLYGTIFFIVPQWGNLS